MKIKLAGLSLVLALTACSSSQKMAEGELDFTEKYYQVYVGGTSESGINVAYFFSLKNPEEATLDSIVIPGFGTYPMEWRSAGTYTATSGLKPPKGVDESRLSSVKLYLHKEGVAYEMKLESVKMKETMFLPSAGGGEEPR